MPLRDIDLLIVGAGIAGASAAYFAHRAGRRVTVLSSDQACASSVPTALINPVRGYQGKLAPRGDEGARFTFSLIDTLVDSGHRIPFARGLWRPVPDAATRKRWSAQFPADFPHRWWDGIPDELPLRGTWGDALFLPQSGWVDTAALLGALLRASACQRLSGEAVSVNVARNAVTLADGSVVVARQVLWCAGAAGAARIAKLAAYRPGSLLLTRTPMTDAAFSYGLYAAPYGRGGVVGPTHEPATPEWPAGPSPDEAIKRLHKRAQAMLARPLAAAGVWHGVRLEAADLPPGLATLTGFGSRGYLLAPLMAFEWVRGSGAGRAMM